MSLESRLEQARRDREIAMKSADKEIEAIQEQIRDSEVTYSIGDRLAWDDCSSEKRMLVKVSDKVAMIDLSDGRQCGSVISPVNYERITKKEFRGIAAEVGYVRYWDSAKERKV